jgi:hypothetical protein
MTPSSVFFSEGTEKDFELLECWFNKLENFIFENSNEYSKDFYEISSYKPGTSDLMTQ